MTAAVHTLTGAYATDALEADERDGFERHLAACADCREEVRTLRETVAVLAAALAVPPPPGLRRRVMAEAGRTRQLPPSGPYRREQPGRPGAPRRVARILLAAAAVLLVGAGAGGVGLHRAEQAQQQLAAARQQVAQVASVLADPLSRRVTGGLAGGGQVSLVVAGPRAVLVTDGAPGLPPGRSYQLWRLRGAEVTSAGLGPAGGSAAGAWSRLVDGIRPGDRVAISVEPDGGSPQPTTTPVGVLQA